MKIYFKTFKRFHSDLRNENDHLNSEMDKTTNDKQMLQEDIKKWRLNSEKMKSEIEDLKDRLKKVTYLYKNEKMVSFLMQNIYKSLDVVLIR